MLWGLEVRQKLSGEELGGTLETSFEFEIMSRCLKDLNVHNQAVHDAQHGRF
jgi:hypothetical protein